MLLGLVEPFSVNAEATEPAIITRVTLSGKEFDDFNKLDIDNFVTIQVYNKGYYDGSSWRIIDYKISVCDVGNGCGDNPQVSIPLWTNKVININGVKIARPDRTTFNLYFSKTGDFQVNIFAIYVRAYSLDNTPPKGWDDCSLVNCKSTGTTPLTLSVKSATLLNRNINDYLGKNILDRKSQLLCPLISESQKTVECSYVVSYSIRRQDWGRYGILEEADSILSGSVNSTLCSITEGQYLYASGEKCDEESGVVGAPPLELVNMKINLNVENKVRFVNQLKQHSFCLTDLVSSQHCYAKYTKTSKKKYSASQQYKNGKAIVLDTSQETLLRQGFFGIFGATGKPVKSKATNWCIGMQAMFPPYIEDKNFTRGCVAAAMSLYRK
jgi:hypothetical protein